MRIQELLRQDFANYIRPAFIGCKCEKCGKSKQLELHHVYRFYDMLKDTLEEFNLEYKDSVCGLLMATCPSTYNVILLNSLLYATAKCIHLFCARGP